MTIDVKEKRSVVCGQINFADAVINTFWTGFL